MTDTDTLIKTMRILAQDIESEDGVANAAIAEAADRLEALQLETDVSTALQRIDKALKERDEARAEVEERKEALLDAARQIDELKKQRNDWFERARLENEKRLDALERLRNQRPDVRPEPSRLEIAAMIYAAWSSNPQIELLRQAGDDRAGLFEHDDAFEEADALIAEAKKPV